MGSKIWGLAAVPILRVGGRAPPEPKCGVADLTNIKIYDMGFFEKIFDNY